MNRTSPFRQHFPAVSAAFLAILLSVSALSAGGTQESDKNTGKSLTIPPLWEPRTAEDGGLEYDLEITRGTAEFFPGTETPILEYNGSLPGPTIKIRRGETVSFTVRNPLDESTTLHWHGAHIPAEMDGGPFQIIGPGETWKPEFLIHQPAATLWYHPHLMGTTAEQVYRGLAGLFIIEDDISLSLPIPREYGVNDIPLITQERDFLEDGSFYYRPAMPDIMGGYFGNVMLVNGDIEPVFPVKENLLRFRILNGSNSTVIRYFFEDDTEFSVIATDGGFLESPVTLSRIVLSPGERAEILVDFSGRKTGETLLLKGETNGGHIYKLLSLPVKNTQSRGYRIPETLVSRRNPPASVNDLPKRRFVLSSMGPGGTLTINGKRMDPGRVDERIPLGRPEVWELINQGMGMMNVPHSFHIHDIQFFILDINGSPPPAHLSGPKDTVLLWPGDRTRILVQFDDYLGKYMYHCHFLEHEDQGMMGVLLVVEPGE